MKITKAKPWGITFAPPSTPPFLTENIEVSFRPQVDPIDAALAELKGLLAEQIASGKASESGYYRATVNSDGSLTITTSPTPFPSEE